jgi:hypothetical protein
MPTGRPCSSWPKGTLMPGTPARLVAMVKMSESYICSGSAVFSPDLKAVVGLTGPSSTSQAPKAAA